MQQDLHQLAAAVAASHAVTLGCKVTRCEATSLLSQLSGCLPQQLYTLWKHCTAEVTMGWMHCICSCARAL